MNTRPAFVPTPAVGRKKSATLVKVLDPDGKEHEMYLANATDMVANVSGWKWPETVVEVMHSFAHAPRAKKTREQLAAAKDADEAREVLKQKLRESGRYDAQEAPSNDGAPPKKTVLPSPDQSPLLKAAHAARASLERDNHGPTADQILGEDNLQEEMAQMAAEVEAAANKKVADKAQSNKRHKAKSTEDDAEVVAKVTGSVAKESATDKLKSEFQQDSLQ